MNREIRARLGRPVAAGALAAVLGLAPGPAGAVGVEGSAQASRRRGVGVGAGVDQVGGYGQDRHPFVEVYGHAEARVWGRLFVGGALSYRQDADDYNFALERWRGRRAPTVSAQLLVGYDGRSFHLAAGPWLYGSSRARDSFRATLLPFGVLRLRVGQLDRWHFNLRIADGAPFTSEGGALGARLMVGAPLMGGHRIAGGLYTSIGEKTAGVAVSDEIAGAGPGGTALRVGGLLGTDLDHPGRVEITGFAGVVW
jgi:hypothetical protein